MRFENSVISKYVPRNRRQGGNMFRYWCHSRDGYCYGHRFLWVAFEPMTSGWELEMPRNRELLSCSSHLAYILWCRSCLQDWVKGWQELGQRHIWSWIRSQWSQMHEWQGDFCGGHLCTPGRNSPKPSTTAAWTGLCQPEPAKSQTMAGNTCGSWSQNLQLTPCCQVHVHGNACRIPCCPNQQPNLL